MKLRMSEPYIAAEYARLVVQYSELNFPREFDQCQGILSSTTEPFERVNLSILDPYLQVIIAAENEVASEWLLARYIWDNTHEMYTYLLSQSENILEAHQLTERFNELVTNIMVFDTQYIEDGSITAKAHLSTDVTPEHLFVFNLFLALGVTALASTMQLDIDKLEIYAPSEDFAQSLRRAASKIPFIDAAFTSGSPLFKFRYSSSFVKSGLPGTEKRLKKILQRELELKLENLPQSEDWVGRIRFYLRFHVEENVEFDDLCEYFCQSRRTMSRRLQNEGTSFTKLYSEVRKERVLDLIGSSMPLKKVASLSGFHRQSTFAATFRKWFGVTPACYRDNLEKKMGPPIDSSKLVESPHK